MTDTRLQPGHGETAPAAGADGPPGNPEVRYERSDVEARGVVVFVAALAVLIVASGAFLVWLFSHFEHRAETVNARESLPLARGERDRLPSSPRLEGIDPTDDVGRAWPDATRPEGPSPWFGYNVRVVPPDGSRAAGTDAEERERLAALAMAKKLKRVDQELNKLAGNLPVRPKSPGMPPDLVRRSAGEGNSGRSAGGNSP